MLRLLILIVLLFMLYGMKNPPDVMCFHLPAGTTLCTTDEEFISDMMQTRINALNEAEPPGGYIPIPESMKVPEKGLYLF